MHSPEEEQQLEVLPHPLDEIEDMLQLCSGALYNAMFNPAKNADPKGLYAFTMGEVFIKIGQARERIAAIKNSNQVQTGQT